MIIGLGTVIFTTSPRALDVDLGALRTGAITILGTKAVAVVIAIAVTVGALPLPLPDPPGQVHSGRGQQP